MGNCLRHESEMHWAGEDWDEFITQHDYDDDDHHHHLHYSKTSTDANKLIVTRDDYKSSDLSSHEIKIRLTKKQLQDLLNKVNVHDLTFDQQPNLINRGHEEANQQRLWRPVLQTIPEVN